MAVKETIENGAREALNVGFGLFKTVEAQIQDLQSQIVKNYEALVAKGAADNGEVAATLRSQLDKGLSAVKDAQTKVEGAVKK